MLLSSIKRIEQLALEGTELLFYSSLMGYPLEYSDTEWFNQLYLDVRNSNGN